MFASGIRSRSVIKLKESANDWNRESKFHSRNPGSTARKSESKGSLPRGRSLGFVTRYCPVLGVATRYCLVRGVGTRYCLAHGAGTRYCLVRGVGTRDEALRTSAWEVIPRVIRLFSTFAVRFSDFVTLKKLTCGKSIGKVKVKPKTSAGVSCLCHPKSNRRVSKLSWPTTLEKYYRTYLQACMNIFRRVTLRSERTDAHLLSLLVKVIFLCVCFYVFFRCLFRKTSFHHSTYFVFFFRVFL